MLKNPRGYFVGALIVFFVGVVIGAPATEPTTTESNSAADVLKAKGLAKVGGTYLVEIDAHLPDHLRALRKAKATLDTNTKKRAAIEGEIKKADDAIVGWSKEVSGLSDRIAGAKDTTTHNQLVSRNNFLVSKIREVEQYRENQQKELRKLVDPKDDYLATLIQVSDTLEGAARQYEALAIDAEVKSALEKINQEAKIKYRLGPSAQFVQELPSIRQQRGVVNSAVIKFEIEGGVPHVNVTLNDSLTTPMIVDSGAAIVSITSDVARKLGLKPGRDDPAIKLKVANGDIVTARLMKLKSVRVGQFTVENVECAVSPASVKDSDCLLGGTFLQNFIYRMDLAAGVLHMSQVSGKPAATKPSLAERASAPTTGKSIFDDTPSNDKNDLLSRMKGDNSVREDGAIILKAGQRIETVEQFKPPVTFKITARTDSTNIRLAYAADQIIFNWEARPKELRIDGGPAAGKHRRNAGEVPKNEWVDFELKVEPDSMTIKVNGKQRQHVNADFSEVNQPLGIFTVGGATVKVKAISFEH